MLLKHQADVGNQNPMPTDRVDDASVVTDVAAETLTWFFLDTGAWASATGEAAGTLVWGKLGFDGVLNSNKATLGSYNNTSYSFDAATRFDTLVTVPENVFSDIQSLSATDQAAKMGEYLTTNGEYAIDHRRGQIWGLALDTVADDAVSYSYKAPVAGSGGPSSNVNVAKFGGTAVTLGQKTSAASIPVVLPSDIPASTGSASSGDNTYLSPVDFTAVYASGTTLTLTGIPFTPTSGQFASVKRQDTTGVSVTYTPDVKAFSYNSGTGVLTVTGAAFTATDVFVVTIMAGPPKQGDTLNNARYNNPIRDLSDQHTPDTLVNTTNVATGTKYYLSVDDYKNLAFGGAIIDGAGETTSIKMFGTTVKGSTTATDYVQMYFHDEENNTNVNEISVTNDTKYFLCSYEGLGKITDVYFLLTTSAATNTVYLNANRQY